MRGAFNAFVHSATRASGYRFAMSFLIAAFMLCILEGSLRYRWIGRLPLEYTIREGFDFYTHAVWAASRVETLPAGTVPVYLFGGSGLREAVLREAEMAELLNDACAAHQYRVFEMTSFFRTVAQDFALLDLVEDRPGIIVYGLNYARFTYGVKDYLKQVHGMAQMGRNREFLEFMKRVYPDRPLIDPVRGYLSAHTYLLPATRLAAEKLRALDFEPKEYSMYLYETRLSEEDLEQKYAERHGAAFFDGYKPVNFEMNMVLLGHFLKQAKVQGHRVLIVEQPLDYMFFAGRLERTVAFCRSKTRELAAEIGAGYTDFEKGLDLDSTVFGDYQHLMCDEARRAFTRRLVSEIVEWQRKE